MPTPLIPPPTTARSKTSGKRGLRPLEQTVDESVVVIDAEAEADPPTTAVGEDAVCGEPPFDLFGAIEIEREEIAAREALRRGQRVDRKQREIRIAKAREEPPLQPGDMRVDLARRDAELVQPAHHRVEPVQARCVERRSPEAHRGIAVPDRLAL